MTNKKNIFFGITSVFLGISLLAPSFSFAAYAPYPNQTVDISISSGLGAPLVTIDLAEIVNVSASTMGISVFGRTYTLDISRAQFFGIGGATVTAQSFSVGGRVSVRGTLDATDKTLVHAQIVRSPTATGTGPTNPTGCTINIVSNIPTNWLIGGPNPNHLFILSPNYPTYTPAGIHTTDSSGNLLPAGSYGILLPQVVNDWASPVVTPAANQMCQSGGSVTFNVAYSDPNGSGGGSVTPKITAQNLFTLSPGERVLFTPPNQSWLTPSPFTGTTGDPLASAWNAFNTNSLPATLDPNSGTQEWYNPLGIGSQNHGMLWQGMSSLSHALRGNVAEYEVAAGKAMELLALDKQQGHQRHESLGYGPYWTGPVAAMAMAGLYAPAGSTSGPELLAAAREWWADHITILRSLRMPDGQIAILGARQNYPYDPGSKDLWYGLYSGLIMQIADPIPYSQLHPAISALITADGRPSGRNYSNSLINWYRPLEGVSQWLVLRAVQSGALLPVPANHTMPAVDMDVYKWTSNGRTYVAAPKVCGYSPWRWKVSWAAGEVLEIEVAEDPGDHVGKGPHASPEPLNIPNNAAHLFGPAGSATQCAWY